MTPETHNTPVPARKELFIIDKSVDDIDLLQTGLPAHAFLLMVDSESGLHALTEQLRHYRQLDAVHIVSHGEDGGLLLGGVKLAEKSLEHHADFTRALYEAMIEGGDILLYGCEVARSEKGEAFIAAFARATRANMAASSTLTGAANLDGDWGLAFEIGSVSTKVGISASVQGDYAAVFSSVEDAPIGTDNPASCSSSELVDGATVEKCLVTENGQDVIKTSVSPITSDRQDTDDGSSLADIPLQFNNTSGPVLTLRLPEGVGATARSSKNAIDSSLFPVQWLRENYPASDWFAMIQGLSQWLDDVGAAWFTTVSFSSDANQASAELIKIDRVEDDKHKAVLIDASRLPEETILNIDNIEFVTVIGEVTVRGGSGSNILFAGGGTQDIMLGPGDDLVHGGSGNDTIGSGGGDNQLFGSDGNDLLLAGTGSDDLHGGNDSDTVVFSGTRDQHLIGRDHAITRVTLIGNPEETITAINVETLRFSDQDVIVNYDQSHEWLAGLYTQTLGRQPDANGFQFWAAQVDQGASVADVANGFFFSQEFGERWDTYPGGLDSDETLDLYYNALLGREPDPSGYEFWQQYLQSGGTQDDVLHAFVMSDEMQEYHQPAEDWDFLV